MYIGMDPELAVVAKNGQAVSAHHFYPPKDAPIKTGYSYAAHPDMIFRDGTSLEMNTPGGMVCIGYIMDAVNAVLRGARGRLPAGKGMQLRAVSSYTVKEDLRRAPEDVTNSGCSPVRNAWEGWEERAVYLDPRSKKRFAGGHIHLSQNGKMQEWLQEEPEQFCPFVVRYLDLYLGAPFVYTGVEGEGGKERRKVYGKAGEYRAQHYKGGMRGIEYRVLGPEWLRDIGLATLVLKQARAIAQHAIEQYSKSKKLPGSKLALMARDGINAGDVEGLWKEPLYQTRLAAILTKVKVLRTGGAPVPAHYEYMRKHAAKLFPPDALMQYGGLKDGHHNWPECWEWWEKKAGERVPEGVTTKSAYY